MYVEDREEYFSVSSCEAIISATAPASVAALSTYGKQLTDVQMSHPKPANVHLAKGLELARLHGRLPSSLSIIIIFFSKMYNCLE